jgi:hypothetical protein
VITVEVRGDELLVVSGRVGSAPSGGAMQLNPQYSIWPSLPQ